MRVLRIYPGANDPRHRLRDHALRRRGLEMGLVLPDKYGADWTTAPVEPELRHWRSPLINRNSIPLHFWRPSALRRAIREFDPDVLDVHEEPFFPSAVQVVLAAAGRPMVMYSAQNMLKHLPPPLLAMQSWVLRRTAGCYPCSAGAADVLRQRGYTGYVDVIPIGVDDELFKVHSEGTRIGFVGRLVPEKGVRDLLAFGPRLLCVGDGPLAGEMAAAGAEVVRANSVDEVAKSLGQMAVLVAPSRTTATWKEQFGRMVVEAMAAGVPVVAYASGSLPEVIGDAGVLVPEGDVQALRTAVERVLRDPGDLGLSGRRRALSHFTWDSVAERMEKLYRVAATRPSLGVV